VQVSAVSFTLAAALAAATLSKATGHDPRVAFASGHATKKTIQESADTDAPDELPPLLATLVQTHSGELVVLDPKAPTAERFDALLADRVTGATHRLDTQLLDLLRALAARHPGARIELVSGFRSAKLNEMLRKKGHHVASHSQHSLGHAADFRIVPQDAERALDPRVVEKEIRKLGWKGGVGVYPTQGDWFVHADVGPNRHWIN
jgi:uncharacterized protein YcbK (DUF882 family)